MMVAEVAGIAVNIQSAKGQGLHVVHGCCLGGLALEQAVLAKRLPLQPSLAEGLTSSASDPFTRLGHQLTSIGLGDDQNRESSKDQLQ